MKRSCRDINPLDHSGSGCRLQPALMRIALDITDRTLNMVTDLPEIVHQIREVGEHVVACAFVGHPDLDGHLPAV